MSDPEIDIEISTGIDQIAISSDDSLGNIQVIEVNTQFSAVTSVNSLVGDVNLTYLETLSYLSPVNGVYTYTVTHNLEYDNPIVMVYNTDNEAVIVEHDAIDLNTVEIISLSNMNNFKVVIQR